MNAKSQNINCECGSSVRRYGLLRHQKTIVHQLNMKKCLKNIKEVEQEREVEIEAKKEELSDQLIKINTQLQKKKISKKKKAKLEEELLQLQNTIIN